jgi:Kef-type K+ transport system membrane component KefB
MNTLEELELRKKESELRRDIAHLERNERLISHFDPALIWAVPLIAFVSLIVATVVYSSGLKSEPSVALGVLIAISLFAIFWRIRRNRRVRLNQERNHASVTSLNSN